MIRAVKENYPLWRIENIYSGLDDPQYRNDIQTLNRRSVDLLKVLDETFPSNISEIGPFLTGIIREMEELGDIAENLSSYTYLIYSTDTSDELALKKINALEKEFLLLKRVSVKLRKKLLSLEREWQGLLEGFEELKSKRFHLEELLMFARHEMSEDLEDLAADLSRSGAEAWGRLQETITSHLQTVWEDATGEKKTLVELRQLAAHPDREVRKKAYGLELEILKQHENALAASLNGVKGFTVTLNERRGWVSTLEKSARQSRLSQESLDALISVLHESLPVFQRYLRAKARALKLPVCGFFDLFAPVGEDSRRYSWNEARDFILQQFSRFSGRMAALAQRAFDEGWIHAQSLPGKVGGAYCISLPLRGESRILSNFDGTFGEVKTLAHELGHAYHFEVLKTAGNWDRQYPMTLAETASTFAETIVFEAAYQEADNGQALHLLENQLQDITQVCVDILSRYLFESHVLEKRVEAELSPSELCQLMIEAQQKSYGVGLDQNYLHPYMWAVKGHYYNQDLAFYNFPYAFGQLLSLSLYERFRRDGSVFAEKYDELLAATGKMSCEEVVGILGEDIRTPQFWRNGITMVERLITDFEARLA